MRFRPLLSLGVSLATGAMVAAVYAQAAKAPAPTAATNGEVIIKNSPAGTGVYDDSTGIARLTKDVTIVQAGEDFILYAQDLTYNKPKNQAVATGNLRVETRDSTIRGERIFADFEKKIITITGNVVITTHGKGDGITKNKGFKAEYGRKPSRILCTRADWDYEAREAVLTGNLRMTQGDNSGTCDRIVYAEEENVAQLIGRVRFRNSENQLFNTPDLTIFIDEGRISTKNATMRFNARPKTPAATPRPVRKGTRFGPAPSISDDQVKQFNLTPPPIPTPRPEPTESPLPVVQETPIATPPTESEASSLNENA